ncbi:MAG: RdgB/HAM1 family non-canonical purine NTP pyrophosphatase [Firmicutes bacterium]|nr:RdgB/HAM1 family non-canonical purine NTP pyrophosphatase [Bacillota bacterium]
MRIVAATQNAHKLVEIRAITDHFGFELLSQADAGLADLDVEETGLTFEENSFIKAEAICRASGMPAIADDSGLAVDALGGAPGVFSARYSGIHGDDAANRRKLLEDMKDIPEEERGAKFVCVITLVFPDGRKLVSRGECPGRIGFEEKGDHGFGYDSLFIPDGLEQTFAEVDAEIKNGMSHRARALEQLKPMLEGLLK